MKYLFIDDIRMPGDVTWIRLPNVAWSIARSYDQAVEWVETNGFPDAVSFDHDLGIEEFDTTESGIVIAVEHSHEKTGYDFAKWLIDRDLDTGNMPDHFEFYVHSMNPIGAKNIHQLLTGYIKQRS